MSIIFDYLLQVNNLGSHEKTGICQIRILYDGCQLVDK